MIRTFVRVSPIIILILILTTGCWDRKELNNLAIASAIGIEKKDGHYRVIVQIENAGEIAKKSASGTGAPVATFQTNGKTVFEALRKMSTVSPREIYVSHLRFVVLSEELAQEGIGKALEFFSRYANFRTDFNIFIARKSEVINILTTLTQIEKIPGISIFSSIRSSVRTWGEFQEISIDQFISKMESDTGAVLPGLSYSGDEEISKNMSNIQNSLAPAHIKLSGMAVFKKDRLRGWLNEMESIGLNFTQNAIKETVVHVPCGKEGNMAVDIFHTKAKVKSWIENEKPYGGIDLYIEGSIGEIPCPIDVSQVEKILLLEKNTNKEIEKYVSSALRKSQKSLRSDIFGFGEELNRSNPKKWGAFKKNWDAFFVDLPVEITVKTKLRSSGQTLKSFLENVTKE
ncbi:Ger(x)C family spore germination protein [uncultured Brevibacillus sp.]|uniref:Ger(x)C family spore germination protein n=1 Tax=uncultured Brevibacillus sp. TaxID=169970 RepID=UPI0025951D59|nr:Ger(x)C family spore germination protein [uncultured Brevibacillus sp.]